MNGTSECPRLTVFRSNKHIYAQLVDDLAGKTVLSASSFDVSKPKKDSKKKESVRTRKVEIAYELGVLVGEKAKKAKIQRAIFDRSGYKYHGRVAAVAEGARSKGLQL